LETVILEETPGDVETLEGGRLHYQAHKAAQLAADLARMMAS